MGNIIEYQNYFPKTNTNKNMRKLLQNADEIMKKRKSSDTYIMERGKNYSKIFVLNERKEICKKNYSINLLRQKRTDIGLKSYLMDKALENFNNQFDKDYHNFNKFISIKEEDILGKVTKIREQKESILKQEQSLNESLHNLAIRKVKAFLTLRKYGSFFHELICEPFLYDEVPSKISEDINFEDILNIIINIYETKEKFLELPPELNNDDLFVSKYVQLEDMILSMIKMKRNLDKEIAQDKIKYNKELDLIKQIKNQYERDWSFYKYDKFLMDLEIKKSSMHIHKDFDEYLDCITELGIELGVQGNLPKKNGIFLDEFISFGEKAVNILENLEKEINKYIDIIEKIEIIDKKNKDNIIKDIILQQKNINKIDFKLSFKQIKEKEKKEKDLKTIEKGKKLVLKGRYIYQHQTFKHIKKIKKIFIKEENDEDELRYSDSEEEKNKK